MSVPSNREHHYQNLRDRYSNCTYVDGNLELTWIENKDLDLTFLQDIREVTGYVLISHVDVKRIVLPNLQVSDLWKGKNVFSFKLWLHLPLASQPADAALDHLDKMNLHFINLQSALYTLFLFPLLSHTHRRLNQLPSGLSSPLALSSTSPRLRLAHLFTGVFLPLFSHALTCLSLPLSASLTLFLSLSFPLSTGEATCEPEP